MARKILLADDSVTAQNMGRKILTDAGYEVVTVNNGSAALKKMAETKPDLIVLDVYMPGYSGLEVCQRIKENRETARIPVLLTVGKLEPFKPEEARRARADAFVVKPFEASELLAALSKLEDKIIPQPEPYKQGRFAKAVASVEQDSDAAKFGDSDEGWKARLRIPVTPPKAKDSEAEPDYAATQGKGFRDFVEKPSSASAPKTASMSAEFDRPVPAGVPHDITPEEIAAIAAAAAQLSGAASVHEAPQDEPSHRAAEVAPGLLAGRSEQAAPVTFANSPEVAAQQTEPLADATREGPGDEPVGFAQAVIPADPAEVAPEPATPAETIPDSSAPIRAQEPAAMQMAEAPEEEFKNEALAQTTAEASADAARETTAEQGVKAPEMEAVSEVPVLAPYVPEEPAAPVADDEVMAALQTLMPGPDGDSASARSLEHQGLTSIPADASNNREHSGPRWIAEEVAMAGDEALCSLEDEMNQAYGIHHIEAVRTAVKAEDEPAVSAVSAVSADTGTPAQTDGNPAVYAMASAAAVGETVAVPWTPSANVTAHENFAIETPSVREEGVSEPEVGANQASPVATDSDTNEIVGGTEVMAANWKNIRDSIAGAAAKPAPSKEHFQEPETMKSDPDAITPLASESARASLGATDPTAIANIVESVLAELRPKIVEEIARKLADPKKS